jgi:Fe-S oxidoreductase
MSLEEFKPMMERCSNCLNCRWSPFDQIKSQRFGENCPSICYNNFSTYSARGRFQLALGLINGELDYTDKIVDVIHNCTACGACDITCKICRYNLEPLEHNLELKARAVQDGRILPRQKPVIESLKKEKTMLAGKLKADRTNWAKGLGMKDLFKEKAEVAFFPGCKYSYEPELQKIARSAVEILLKSGVDLGFLGSADNCCAGRAYQMGFRPEFDERAEANIKAFETAGVKTIVTPCSDCYHTLKRLYAPKGLKIEVLHIVEYLDRLISQKKIQFTKTYL